MTARGIIFRSAFTFAGDGDDPRLLRWRRRTATWLARRQVAVWRRAGDSVLAAGDEPEGLPDDVSFVRLRDCQRPEQHEERLAWAAWLAFGWYRGTGAEEVAAALCVDGLDLCSALEPEKLWAAEALLERVDLALELRRRYPGVAWHADGSATDITRCPDLGVAPLLPAGIQDLMRRLELRYRAAGIRRDFMRPPATGARACAGSRLLVMPLFGLNLQGLRNHLPYLKLLAEQAQNELLLVAPLPELLPLLRTELGGRARLVAWNDYWTPGLEQRARERWHRFQLLLHGRDMMVRREQGYRYRDLDLAPALADTDDFLHGPLAREIMRYAAVFEEIIERERPAALLLALDSGWRERILVDVARRAGVPTVCQHNAQITPYPELAALRAVVPPAGDRPPGLRWQVVSDRATLIGRSMLDKLVAGGCDPAGLRVAGLPRYDGFAVRRADLSREKVRAELGVPEGMRVVLLASQPWSQSDGSTRIDRVRAARALAAAVAGMGDVFLLVKPHHAEHYHNNGEILAASGAPGRVISNAVPLLELLPAADALITYFSTAAFEAMAMEVPVMTINICGLPDPVPYAASGAAVGVYKLEDIAGGLRRVLTPDARRASAAREFLTGMIDLREGAAQRCATAVTEVLRP